MSESTSLSCNFAHLKELDEQLLWVGMLAKRYFTDAPNTCLLKLRQLAELLAQSTASLVGILREPDEGQYELLARLGDQGIPRDIHQLFSQIRRTGNAANHALAGDHSTALASLGIAWPLGIWFHCPLPVPPLAEQHKIERRVDTLFNSPIASTTALTKPRPRPTASPHRPWPRPSAANSSPKTPPMNPPPPSSPAFALNVTHPLPRNIAVI